MTRASVLSEVEARAEPLSGRQERLPENGKGEKVTLQMGDKAHYSQICSTGRNRSVAGDAGRIRHREKESRRLGTAIRLAQQNPLMQLVPLSA